MPENFGLSRYLETRQALDQDAMRQQQMAAQQQFMADRQSLGPNPTPEQLMGVAAKYADPKSLLDVAAKMKEEVPIGYGGLYNRTTNQVIPPAYDRTPLALKVTPDSSSSTGFSYQDMRRPGVPLAEAPSPNAPAPSVRVVPNKGSSTGYSYSDMRNPGGFLAEAPAPPSAPPAGSSPMGSNPNFWFEYYDKTKQLPPMAWGAAGNPTRQQFLDEFPKWKAAQGGTASDTATSQAGYRASSHALASITKDLNTFEPYKKMLDTNADIAVNLGRKIYQTNAALANRPLNWLRQNATSNPDVAEYLAQMRFVQTEAARVIQNPRIVGPLTDTARKEIEGVIDGSAPIPVVERVLARLKTDGSNRFIQLKNQQVGLANEITKGIPTTISPPVTALTPVGATPSSIPEFATEAEAAKANLKPGTKVKIGGTTGTWQ